MGVTIEVIDKNGWHREYTVEKAIIHIGSDAQNDIALDATRGAGVAPRHLQLIAGDTGYRLVNLDSAPVEIDVSGNEIALEPRSTANVGAGAEIQVGEFTLVLHSGDVSRLTPQRGTTSETIGLRVNLPRTTLGPEQPIEGSITVSNLGDETGVQFELEVEGLPDTAFQLGPAPILFPGALKEIFFRLRHPHGPALRAGDHRISIHATAPDAYPGERATVKQTVHVAPHFSHTVELTPLTG